ncbi:MAG: hypothetical protein ABIE55_00855 [Candidatus Aenigmatarchaeota archaeon]
MKRKKVNSLFSKEALDKLKRDRFNGKLMVFWENGMIKDMNLRTNFRYSYEKDDFFIEE